MGAQTWEDVKGEVGAFLVGGAIVAAAMIAGACAMWPEAVIACVLG